MDEKGAADPADAVVMWHGSFTGQYDYDKHH